MFEIHSKIGRLENGFGKIMTRKTKKKIQKNFQFVLAMY